MRVMANDKSEQKYTVLLGASDAPVELAAEYANRHGLIAGATGTGKTVSLQVVAEGFSRIGVPVFMADVKGDLSGLIVPSSGSERLLSRAEKTGPHPYLPSSYPVLFWDLFGDQGHPVRTTISELGPLLLSRLLELNDTQEGVLNVAFRVADEEGLLLLDLPDLRALLHHVAEHRAEYSARYGNVSSASVSAIQRRLLVLETQGGEHLFGEPALQLEDLMRLADDGRGTINILAADKLIRSPRLYATFLLWLLSELFESLPEVGDPHKPKLVLFFDEAHLLFDDAPKALIDKVEQVVRLIRSKGVGVFFVTQNPMDIPDDVASQIGNRIQHALRAFTPRDQKVAKAAADSFRPNPELDARQAITELGVGEALVSTLVKKGVPGIVQRTLMRPPDSQIGPASADQRATVMAASELAEKYDERIDRESAYEVLADRAQQAALEAEQQKRFDEQRKAAEKAAKEAAKRSSKRRSSSRRKSTAESFWTSTAKSLGTQLGRTLLRGLLGSLTRK